jgi:lysophospholipase L1-like esterase
MKSTCGFTASRLEVIVLLVFVSVYGGLGHAADPAGVQRGDLKARRILFLGNSITLHGPLAEIGWTNNWGMAASAQGKDYVHVLVNSVAKLTGSKPDVMVANIADFERHYDTYDVNSKLKKHLEFKADIVIVAIGENVPAPATEESKTKFKDSFAELLTALKSSSQPAILVRSCFWPDKTKDEIMQQSCGAVGGVFVDISSLGKDESNHARAERSFSHGGVADHPGDKGMKAIADALLRAMTNRSNDSVPKPRGKGWDGRPKVRLGPRTRCDPAVY